jgi:hypothetical protein
VLGFIFFSSFDHSLSDSGETVSWSYYEGSSVAGLEVDFGICTTTRSPSRDGCTLVGLEPPSSRPSSHSPQARPRVTLEAWKSKFLSLSWVLKPGTVYVEGKSLVFPTGSLLFCSPGSNSAGAPGRSFLLNLYFKLDDRWM